MREGLAEGYIILIPNELTFIFNPQKIKFRRTPLAQPATQLEKVSMNISAYEMDFSEERTVQNINTVEFDISRYLQLHEEFLIEKNGQMIKTIFPYNCHLELFISNGNIIEFDFNGLAIFGALNIGDNFNPSRKITWFRQFPFTFSVFVTANTHMKYSIDNGTIVDWLIMGASFIYTIAPNQLGMSAENSMQYIFENNADDLELYIDFKINDCTKGIYLRWLDKHGFYQYYLFENVTETIRNENNGDRLLLDFTDSNEYYHDIATQNKNETKEFKIATALADKNTCEMLKSIFSSPIVEMYIGETGINANYDAFVSVIVSNGNYTPTSKDLQDFELTISLTQQTQNF